MKGILKIYMFLSKPQLGIDNKDYLIKSNIFIYVLKGQMLQKIIFILLGLMTLLTYSQILSIDYGTQFVKAALVHTGAGKTFSIVENPKSQRKFINAMGIYNQERFYEADTLTKRSRGPSNCFIFSRILIDLHDNPNQLEQVKKELILEYLQHPESDQLLAEFIISGMPEDSSSISLLQSIAMMFRYIKNQAQKHIKGQIKDVVITVPCHWNLKQRRFLVDAATLADLYVLSLVHENTAAALNYALSQRTTNDTETILFYNLGANSLQMTLAEFKPIKNEKTGKSVESVFVIGDYGASHVGGLSLDHMIADYFTKKFEEKYKRTLNQRGKIRLLAEAEKTKKVLSANKEATLFIEGIMDGIDFSSTIKRRELEEMAKDLLQKVTKPINRFLFDHDLKANELTAVELIGGGSRVPKLQSLIGEIVGNSSIVGSHINGDQAMVFGAAFYGANSSKKFKVKGINLYDGFNFDVRIVLRNSEEGIAQGDQRFYFKNATLFKKKNRFGLTKQVTFKCSQNLIVDLYKEDDSGVELLSSHVIESIKDINQSSYKISLTFEIHPIQVVKLQEVKYIFSKDVVQSYTEKVRKIVPKNQTKEQEESKSEEQVEETKEEDKDKEDNETKTEGKKKKKKKEKIEYETVERTKNVTKKFENELDFKKTFSVVNEQEDDVKRKANRIFSFFEVKEELKKKLSEAKNKLEALIYEVRERLQQEDFITYSQEEQRQTLETLRQEKSQWYDQTVSSDHQDYLKEFKALNDPLQKIKKRIVEHRERDTVLKRSKDIINDYLNQIKKFRKSKPWITEEEVEELSEKLNEALQKIDKIYDKLQETPVNEDSIFRNKDMIKESDLIKDKFFALKGKTKPKGFKEQKKEDKEDKTKNEQEEKEQEVKEDEL